MISISLDNQSGLPVSATELYLFSRFILSSLKITKAEISLALVNEPASRRLNLSYRGLPRATDVLSFVYAHENFLDGEIVICSPVAVRQARAFGHSTRQEILRLLVHGLLHLAGYDHEKKSDAEVMEALELKLLTAYRARRKK